MLNESLRRVAREYVYERAKPFTGSAFGNFVRHDLAEDAKRFLLYLPYDLKVKASVGAGNWAAVPWLAFFDPLITETATKGFYVVYLINAQTEDIYLSLNQGTTAVYQEFGEKSGREILRRRAGDIRDRVAEFASSFDPSPIELGSLESLPLGYQAGHAFGRRYHADSMEPDTFNNDLEKMLSAYSALVERGGLMPSDAMIEEAGSTDIRETRKYVLSKRIERAPSVRKRVLEMRGTICEGCGLDPSVHYSFSGPLTRTPLDVHHAKPLNELAEGESRRYKVPDDFFVLCPNCHRNIHSQNDPSDLKELKRKIRFGYSTIPRSFLI